MIIQKNTKKSDILKLDDCKKCGKCCHHGSGSLIDEDVPKIASFLKITEQELKEKYLDEHIKFNTKAFKPKIQNKDKVLGACIFFDSEKGCKIHSILSTHWLQDLGVGFNTYSFFLWKS